MVMMPGSKAMLPRLARWRSALARQFRHLLGAALIAAPAGSALAAWNTTAEALHEHPTWIFTPPHAMANGKHALLIVLHGCDQTHTALVHKSRSVASAKPGTGVWGQLPPSSG
jgi:poly(3-hydroxybutyrate) depolymerase